MAALFIHLLYIATISQSLIGSHGNQAPVRCEVCDVTDSDCVKGGARTVCDVTQQYCLTEVTDTLAGDRTVGRKCVDLTECEQKFAVTEERLYCYEVDMGNLWSDVTCNFCCQGDLCNQGPDLIPPAQFLYNGDLNITGPSTSSLLPSSTAVMTSSVIDSSTPGMTTVPVDMCEVCDVTDPDCFQGGSPTSCDSDHSFCMTTVHDNYPNNMTVSRSCVNESVCYQKWYMETSWRHYCFDIDQGELYFSVDCNFCCVGDLCNAGPTLVPSPETLYQPKVVPTVSGTSPTSVVTSEGSSTTPNDLTVPSQSHQPGSTTDGVTESTAPGPQELSTDASTPSSSPKSSTVSTSPTSPNAQGSSMDYFTGQTSSSPQRSSSDYFTAPTPSGPHVSSSDYFTAPTSSSPQRSSSDYFTAPTPSGPQRSSSDYFTGPTPSGPQGASTNGLTDSTPSGTQWSSSDGSTSPEGFSTGSVGLSTGPEGSTATHVTQPSTLSTTEKHTICEVCDDSDPECFTSGTPTRCDLEELYCMTTVHDNYPSNMTVSRGCVNESVCYQKWYMETSWRHYCFDIDQGELYFSVDCNFCCVGDLCNAGPTLVPSPETLYQPPPLTTEGTTIAAPSSSPNTATAIFSTETSMTTSTTYVSTTEKHTICEVCDDSDPECFTSGTPTRCDLEESYCMTTVHDNYPSNMTASRGCVNESVCYQKWYMETSWRHYCFDVDQGELYFSVDCNFCCVGDLCNAGPTLVPSPETLYRPPEPTNATDLSTSSETQDTTTPTVPTTQRLDPTASSSTPLPMSTAHPGTTETTSEETQTTSGVTQTSTESTTMHYATCDTCSSDDPNCMTRGQPTTCDLDTPLCMTSVTEDMTSTQTATRMCVNETVCQVEWLQKTSSKYYCYKVDQGPLYFASTCSFCCRGDLCNSGTLVPDTHKLYVLPPTTATDLVSTTP